MSTSRGMVFIATLTLLSSVCHRAMDSNASDGDAPAHALSVKVSVDNTASIPDFDGDGTIGFGDFVKFAANFGLVQGDDGYDAQYDLNGDDEIGFGDFVIFAQNFGREVRSLDLTMPQIYNDNVFVLPVEENLAALWTESGNLPPLEDYASRFYEFFNDEFDFLIIYPNVDYADLEPEAISGAYYESVRNGVQGIGLDIFANNRSWSSAGRLQGVVFHNFDDESTFRGLLLHELMHRWGNFVVPITSFPYGAHWGLSTSGGYLDCYDISNWTDHGDREYSAPDPIYITSSEQYSPIELYLAGFIPPHEVPEFQVAENGEILRWVPQEDRHNTMVFTASGFKTHTIEGIIAEHGPRVPDYLQAQKEFRAAVIFLISDKYPATRERLERLSNDVTWFSKKGTDESDPPVTNFYEATGGRGTITMDGLSQLKRRAGAKITVPNSFGTPPLPVVDQWNFGSDPKDDAANFQAEPERP